jgi:hypothetical protein
MRMHTNSGHQILSKRIINSWLHVDVLPVARFFIPEYLTDKEGVCEIELFLLIAIFTLGSILRLILKRFGEVFADDLEPGGAISMAQDILEFQERLQPAPVKSSPCLVELW